MLQIVETYCICLIFIQGACVIFRQNAAIIRQRSYSMPSNAFKDLMEADQPSKSSHPATLDEAVTLLSKKKIGKTEVDAQSLLHRAADAGQCS